MCIDYINHQIDTTVINLIYQELLLKQVTILKYSQTEITFDIPTQPKCLYEQSRGFINDYIITKMKPIKIIINHCILYIDTMLQISLPHPHPHLPAPAGEYQTNTIYFKSFNQPHHLAIPIQIEEPNFGVEAITNKIIQEIEEVTNGLSQICHIWEQRGFKYYYRMATDG